MSSDTINIYDVNVILRYKVPGSKESIFRDLNLLDQNMHYDADNIIWNKNIYDYYYNELVKKENTNTPLNLTELRLAEKLNGPLQIGYSDNYLNMTDLDKILSITSDEKFTPHTYIFRLINKKSYTPKIVGELLNYIKLYFNNYDDDDDVKNDEKIFFYNLNNNNFINELYKYLDSDSEKKNEKNYEFKKNRIITIFNDYSKKNTIDGTIDMYQFMPFIILDDDYKFKIAFKPNIIFNFKKIPFNGSNYNYIYSQDIISKIINLQTKQAINISKILYKILVSTDWTKINSNSFFMKKEYFSKYFQGNVARDIEVPIYLRSLRREKDELNMLIGYNISNILLLSIDPFIDGNIINAFVTTLKKVDDYFEKKKYNFKVNLIGFFEAFIDFIQKIQNRKIYSYKINIYFLKLNHILNSVLEKIRKSDESDKSDELIKNFIDENFKIKNFEYLFNNNIEMFDNIMNNFTDNNHIYLLNVIHIKNIFNFFIKVSKQEIGISIDSLNYNYKLLYDLCEFIFDSDINIFNKNIEPDLHLKEDVIGEDIEKKLAKNMDKLSKYNLFLKNTNNNSNFDNNLSNLFKILKEDEIKLEKYKTLYDEKQIIDKSFDKFLSKQYAKPEKKKEILKQFGKYFGYFNNNKNETEEFKELENNKEDMRRIITYYNIYYILDNLYLNNGTIIKKKIFDNLLSREEEKYFTINKIKPIKQKREINFVNQNKIKVFFEIEYDIQTYNSFLELNIYFYNSCMGSNIIEKTKEDIKKTGIEIIDHNFGDKTNDEKVKFSFKSDIKKLYFKKYLLAEDGESNEEKEFNNNNYSLKQKVINDIKNFLEKKVEKKQLLGGKGGTVSADLYKKVRDERAKNRRNEALKNEEKRANKKQEDAETSAAMRMQAVARGNAARGRAVEKAAQKVAAEKAAEEAMVAVAAAAAAKMQAMARGNAVRVRAAAPARVAAEQEAKAKAEAEENIQKTGAAKKIQSAVKKIQMKIQPNFLDLIYDFSFTLTKELYYSYNFKNLACYIEIKYNNLNNININYFDITQYDINRFFFMEKKDLEEELKKKFNIKKLEEELTKMKKQIGGTGEDLEEKIKKILTKSGNILEYSKVFPKIEKKSVYFEVSDLFYRFKDINEINISKILKERIISGERIFTNKYLNILNIDLNDTHISEIEDKKININNNIYKIKKITEKILEEDKYTKQLYDKIDNREIGKFLNKDFAKAIYFNPKLDYEKIRKNFNSLMLTKDIFLTYKDKLKSVEDSFLIEEINNYYNISSNGFILDDDNYNIDSIIKDLFIDFFYFKIDTDLFYNNSFYNIRDVEIIEPSKILDDKQNNISKIYSIKENNDIRLRLHDLNEVYQIFLYINYYEKKTKDEKVPIEAKLLSGANCLNKAKVIDTKLSKIFEGYYPENYFGKLLKS